MMSSFEVAYFPGFHEVKTTSPLGDIEASRRMVALLSLWGIHSMPLHGSLKAGLIAFTEDTTLVMRAIREAQ